MKKLLLLIAASLFVFGCDTSNGTAEKKQVSALDTIIKNKTLRLCTDPGYEPFELRDKNNNIIGFDIDLAAEMAEAMGVNLEIVPVAYDGIIPALVTDKCDLIMAGMTLNQERNLQVNFPQPYMLIGQTILLNKSLEGVVTSWEDLNDEKYTIAGRLGVTGSFVAQERMPKATLKLFEAENEAVLEVVNGSADAFVYDYPLCASYKADYPDSLVFLSEPFTYEPLGIAIKRGDVDFLNWIDNFLRQVKGDGRYDELYNYWFNSNEWKKALR